MHAQGRLQWLCTKQFMHAPLPLHLGADQALHCRACCAWESASTYSNIEHTHTEVQGLPRIGESASTRSNFKHTY